MIAVLLYTRAVNMAEITRPIVGYSPRAIKIDLNNSLDFNGTRESDMILIERNINEKPSMPSLIFFKIALLDKNISSNSDQAE